MSAFSPEDFMVEPKQSTFEQLRKDDLILLGMLYDSEYHVYDIIYKIARELRYGKFFKFLYAWEVLHA